MRVICCFVLGLGPLAVTALHEAPALAQYTKYQGGCYASPIVYYQPYIVTYHRPAVRYSYYAPYTECYSYSPQMDQGGRVYRQQQTYQGSGPSGDAGKPATTYVTINAYDNYFEPRSTNVQPGTTVRWVNRGHHSHTVTSNDGRWDSGDIKPGASYGATFKQAGTYSYYCRHHTQDKMQGTIVVGASGANGDGESNAPNASTY